MRVKRGFVSRRRHKDVLKDAKGFRGRRKNCYKLAKLAVQKSLKFAYRDRRNKKRDFRGLWIMRINAAARLEGMTYSTLMNGLRQAGIVLDRKVLAELAVSDKAAFAQIVAKARVALEATLKAAA
jgi:large subunit ribosomal protein L20